MSLEWIYYVAGIVSAIAAIAGLIGLWYYARETYLLRKAAEAQLAVSQDQLENSIKPCVLVVKDISNQVSFDKVPLILKNLGAGVALNVRYQLEKNKGGPWIEAPALAVGDSVASHMILKNVLFRNPLVCEFESLSGVKYETTSFISDLTTDFDLRHTFKRL